MMYGTDGKRMTMKEVKWDILKMKWKINKTPEERSLLRLMIVNKIELSIKLKDEKLAKKSLT